MSLEGITTGLTLTAFIISAGGIAYRAYLRSKVEEIRSASSADQVKIVKAQLNRFNINAKDLNENQRFDLAIKELDYRSRRLLIAAGLIGLFSVLCGGLAIVAIKSDLKPRDSWKFPDPLVDQKIWMLIDICRPYIKGDRSEWRYKYIKDDNVSNFYTIIKSFNTTETEENAKKYASYIRENYTYIDVDAMMTASPAGGNRRWAIVLARSIDNREDACRIRAFAKTCILPDENPYIYQLGTGPMSCN